MRKYALGLLLGTLVSLSLGWVYTYSIASPAGTDSPSIIDDRIREAKAATQERLNIDHYFPLSGSLVSDEDAGQHRQITFHEPQASVTVGENELGLFTKDVDGVAELHYTDESGNTVQLTAAGQIVIAAADIPADSVDDTKILLRNNSYLVSANAAGDGEVNLIKANTGDTPVLGQYCKTYDNTAPTNDQHIANKKYVDDQIGLIGSTNAIFGTWKNTDSTGLTLVGSGVVYRAQCDGFVNIYCTGRAVLITGSTNPPTTVTAWNGDNESSLLPIRKNDYVTSTYSATMHWLAIGSGDLVRQP